MSNNFRNRQIAIAISIFALFFARDMAQGQEICIQNQINLPGETEPPMWWGPAGSNPKRDDQRWHGSINLSSQGGGLHFRALRRTEATDTYLYLSWEARFDINSSDDRDSVAFAVRDTSTSVTKGYYLQFNSGPGYETPDTGDPIMFAADESGGNAVGNPNYALAYTDSSGWALEATPTWLTDTARVWVHECDAGLGICNWTVQLRIPIGSGADQLNIDDTFNVWYNAILSNGPGADTERDWPDGLTAAPPVGSVLNSNFTSWQGMRISGSPCAVGIHISSSQIERTPGVANKIGPTNTFHARPTNDTDASINGNSVVARFRIANWGSAAFDSPEWKTIPADGGCEEATGTVGAVPSGTDFDLTCDWDLSDEQKCQYGVAGPPDGGIDCSSTPQEYWEHQCILVELKAAGGAPSQVVFSRPSAWRNMNFVEASAFSRKAMISTRGLPAISGKDHREVRLYVERKNMPTVKERQISVVSKVLPQYRKLDPKKAKLELRKLVNKPLDVKLPPDVKPIRIDPIKVAISPELKKKIESGKASYEEISQQMPTYVVRVFHETGRKHQIGGEEHSIYADQPSFGFFIDHEGDFYGWLQEIEGVEEVSPDIPGLYRIAEVKDAEPKIVTTKISTVDEEPPPIGAEPPPPPPPPPLPSWIWIAIIVAAILIVVLIVIRRKK